MAPSMTDPDRWFLVPRAVSRPRVRLVCFPYAGGSASVFTQWPTLLSADVEVRAVQLPGRTFRHREPAFTRMAPLVAALEAQLAGLRDAPLALFGHSLGALVAFELARALEARGAGPVVTFVSGRNAADIPAGRPHLHPMADAEFIVELERRYGRSELLHDPETAALALPPLRADFHVLEHYLAEPGWRVRCPLVAFAGRDDRLAVPADVEAWRRLTDGPFELHVLEGGHFFVDRQRAVVAARVDAALRQRIPG